MSSVSIELLTHLTLKVPITTVADDKTSFVTSLLIFEKIRYDIS